MEREEEEKMRTTKSLSTQFYVRAEVAISDRFLALCKNFPAQSTTLPLLILSDDSPTSIISPPPSLAHDVGWPV